MNTDQKQSRKYNKDQKINRIIEVTKNLIESSGIEHTNTNRIAAEANVSVGILYRYFSGGVPSILIKMAELASKSVVSEEILAHRGNISLIDLLRGLLQTNLDEHRKNLSLLRAFEVNFLLHPELFPKKQDLIYIDWKIIQQLFTAYHILNHLTEFEQKEKMEELLFIIDTLTHEYLFNPSALGSDEKFIATLLDIIRMQLHIKTEDEN